MAQVIERKVQAIKISDLESLCNIVVFWTEEADGKTVTITCYGSAWTAYFSDTGGQTIQEFFRDAPTEFLVDELGSTPLLKGLKRDRVYLTEIVEAIKGILKP